jgi:hypothetical protein
MLEDVVVDEVEEVSLLEEVETTLEDVVVDEVEEVSLLEVVERVEVVVEPLEPRTMPTPAAITMRAMTAPTMAILPIPMREVFAINRKNNRSSIFKTSQGGSTVFEPPLGCDFLLSLRGPSRRRDDEEPLRHGAHCVSPPSLTCEEPRHRGL